MADIALETGCVIKRNTHTQSHNPSGNRAAGYRYATLQADKVCQQFLVTRSHWSAASHQTGFIKRTTVKVGTKVATLNASAPKIKYLHPMNTHYT